MLERGRSNGNVGADEAGLPISDRRKEIMQKILVTGALGQIGSELVPALRARYGHDDVVASDVRMMRKDDDLEGGPFEHVDCTKIQQLQDVVRRHDVGTIYHMAVLLSAVAEEKPQAAWDVNVGGLYRILEVARQCQCAVFLPSSIGAFGPTTPRDGAPQDTTQRPTTIYGVTKVASELLCDYYAARFGLDTRALRFPGLISYVAQPDGGTTDYAVDIFYQAIRYRHYTCFLRSDTRLDMMYMPDAIRAAVELMEADPARLQHRNFLNPNQTLKNSDGIRHQGENIWRNIRPLMWIKAALPSGQLTMLVNSV